ncbi:MAG: hypothetical protein IPJ65_30930 [Archangiaceae bacterium]|nr:hypothetical protein [Archangiaceae bacterium]
MARVPTLPGEGEVLPRYVFLETLIPQSTVLEVGAVALTAGHSARFLIERGAASVTALDGDSDAVARALTDPEVQVGGVTFSDAGLDSLSGRTFDLVCVHGVEPRTLDASRLAQLKRLLSRRGRLVLAVRQEEGMAISDLGRRVSAPRHGRVDELALRLKGSFRCVDVASQTLFFGYAVTPEGRDDVETALDESLAGQAAPAYRLYVCGIEPLPVSAASLTPLAPQVLDELNGRLQSALADPLGLASELNSEVDQVRVEELERRTQQAIEEAERAELLAAQALAERDGLKAKIVRGGIADEARAEAARLAEELEARQVEHEARLLRTQALAREASAADASARAALEQQLAEAAASLEKERAQLETLLAEAETHRRERASLELKVSAAEKALEAQRALTREREEGAAALTAKVTEVQAERAELEVQLSLTRAQLSVAIEGLTVKDTVKQ